MPVKVHRRGSRYVVLEKGSNRKAVKKTYSSKAQAQKAATARNLGHARKRGLKVPPRPK